MQPIKIAVFGEVKKQHTDLQSLDDEELNKLLFHHPAGLRLSLTGFKIIRKIFTAYSFELPNTIKSRHQYNMGKMEFPFYLTSKRLVLFSEMDAMVVKLHGDIKSFLEIS